MPETDDKLRPGDLARALTAVVPEGSTAALVDTSAAAVERLASALAIFWSAGEGEFEAGPGLTHSYLVKFAVDCGLASTALRALLAERDAMHVDINRIYAERQALEDQCVALQRERDEAITALGVASRAQGLAEGKLEASETAGVVDGWKRRAEVVEAALRNSVGCALNELAAAGKPMEWSPRSGIGVALRVLGCTDTCLTNDVRLAISNDALSPELREMVDQS